MAFAIVLILGILATAHVIFLLKTWRKQRLMLRRLELERSKSTQRLKEIEDLRVMLEKICQRFPS